MQGRRAESAHQANAGIRDAPSTSQSDNRNEWDPIGAGKKPMELTDRNILIFLFAHTLNSTEYLPFTNAGDMIHLRG